MIECPVVSVHIPPALRPYTKGHDEVVASGDTMLEVLESLGHTHPGIIAQLIATDGRLSPAFDVYLGASKMHGQQGLATPVGQEDSVTIIPAVAAQAS